MSDSNRPGEFELIARYFAPLAAGDGTFELLDDAATVKVPEGHDLVMTLDTLAANVHFFSDDPAASIAWKALAVNASDLAAKGAEPIGYLLSLALPKDWNEPWLADFADGLAKAQDAFGLTLIGGDTIRSNGGLQVAITAYGAVQAGKMVRRSGASPGDFIYVTGTIGDGALGLQARQENEKWLSWGLSEPHTNHLVDRYLHPQPRLALRYAVRSFAEASMDISDGLVGDLAKMCGVSRVGAQIDLDHLPLSEAVCVALDHAREALQMAVTGGDDYELLIAVSPDKQSDFEQAVSNACETVTCIGRFTEATCGITWTGVNRPADTLKLGAFTHF